MIATAHIDRLRQRPPTPGSPVLSIYLDVDQSRPAGRQRAFEVALRARIRAIEQHLGDSERETFRADAARAMRFVTQYEPHAKTLVLFADDSADWVWSGDLRIALPVHVRWEPAPYVRPLLEALDEHERYGVVLVDKERARLFTVFLDEIEDEREALTAAEVRHKQASGTDRLRSQMNLQRQDDMHVRSHLRRTAELMEQMAREHGFDRLVLAGPVEVTSELARLLRHPLDERVVATLRLPIDAAADEVLGKTREVVERQERAVESARVTQVLDGAAVGLEQTLAMLQQGRLFVLVYADDFAARGRECPRCRALFAEGAGSACAYCGEGLVLIDELVERLLERIGEVDATAEQVHGEAADRLRRGGGIGAILRF